MPSTKRQTPRPQRHARHVLRIYKFKERQGFAATLSMTQVHAACRDSKWAQLCTSVIFYGNASTCSPITRAC
jgi:hypothetical protein